MKSLDLPLDNLFIPSKTPSKQLLIVLHGRGDSSEGFEASQSFLFGFSQGSLLTFEFGLHYEKKLAGYIAISGYIHDVEKLAQEMHPNADASSWLCTHGRFDNVLPYETSKTQIEFLQKSGFDIEFVSYDKEHTLDRDELTMI